MKDSRPNPSTGRALAATRTREEELAAMICDHDNAVDCALVAAIVRSVQFGRRTPEQALARLVRLCPCGRVNVTQALRILNAIRRAGGERAPH